MKPLSDQPSLQLKKLGFLGETLASRYLISHGYTILERNFKARYGELDIVAIENAKNQLVIVEVKTRIGREFGLPEEAVTPRKLREVVKTTQFYIATHPSVPEWVRIDVIGIELNGNHEIVYFNHIQNASG